MKHVIDAYLDVGPAVLIDEQRCADWREVTFDEAIVDRRFEDPAARGELCHFHDCEVRQFSGQTVVLIDEPPPDLVKYAFRSVKGLRLELPTGALRFVGLCSLLSDARVKRGDEELLSLELTPGIWVVDAWDFVEHATRLEDPAAHLPGESPLQGALPDGRWTRALQNATVALALLTGALTLFVCLYCVFPTAYLAAVGAVAVLWVLRFGARRALGEHLRERHNAAVYEAYLASLPELPSHLVVLRPADLACPPQAGGGLS